VSVQKSQLRFPDEPHLQETEYDYERWPAVGRLANADAIVEKVRYAALMSALRETRVLGRDAQTPAMLRLRLLDLANQAVASWFEVRAQAPASTPNSEVEGESFSDDAFMLFAVGLDSPDRVALELFERLA
jgi:hypothetical protein